MKEKTFDGFFFTPTEDDNELNLSFFDLADEFSGGIPIGETKFGSTYHIAFFKADDDGYPIFDESFEAIFGDPEIYVNGLIGSELFGCILKKTTKSGKWFQDYLTKTMEDVKMFRTTKKLL
jgi:hypothetical protein